VTQTIVLCCAGPIGTASHSVGVSSLSSRKRPSSVTRLHTARRGIGLCRGTGALPHRTVRAGRVPAPAYAPVVARSGSGNSG